ncbi:MULTISPECIES: hypothetical protein [Metallosphaera]|uniref:hypothetical protein n=1 Tax=Metallosphaera TaxID=41980 RepID=UPI001F059191|nr:hypothetical protein [Metallosphaera sedula]MCH1771752.1 hypothetical protein [Metallosphaera sedula]MCP6728350.1 hypothetical protein [Metallosphaera sedula]
MLKFPELVKAMRRFGPNLDLLESLLKERKEVILSYLESVKELYFTPVLANRFLRISFDQEIDRHIRLSLKGKSYLSLGGEGVPVTKIENFSGNPYAYNHEKDQWDMTIDATWEPLVYEFQYEGEAEPLPFSRFRSYKTLNEMMMASLNLGTIQGFIVDYGRRDFVLLVKTPYKEIKENLQTLPFIRYTAWLGLEQGTTFLMEFSIPEEYLKEIMEVLHDLRHHVNVLLTTTSFEYFKPLL